MPKMMQDLIKQYVEAVKKIYGSHVRQIILYGSYARGDFRPDSDVDIMILVLYRRETARNDLKSARALFFIEDYKGLITERTIPSFMQLMQYMLSAVKHIKDIKMLWQTSIRIM